MQHNWKDRIDWVMRMYAGGNQSEFAAAIGFKQPSVNGWLNGATPSGDALAAILERYPQVNPDYLLLGGDQKTRVHTARDPLVAVRRAALAVSRVLAELEDELGEDALRDVEIERALETLRRFGYDIDLGAFGGRGDVLTGFRTEI